VKGKAGKQKEERRSKKTINGSLSASAKESGFQCPGDKESAQQTKRNSERLGSEGKAIEKPEMQGKSFR